MAKASATPPHPTITHQKAACVPLAMFGINLKVFMIYGYPRKIENEYGLVSLKEVSLQTSSAVLRDLASMLVKAANAIDQEGGVTAHWHLHCDPKLAEQLGCEIIVTAPVGSSKPTPRVHSD